MAEAIVDSDNEHVSKQERKNFIAETYKALFMKFLAKYKKTKTALNKINN